MGRKRLAAILPLLIAVSCGDTPAAHPPALEMRSPEPVHVTPLLLTARPIDWSRSAGVFIGVQKFHDGSDLDVAFAADDAVDLAYLFTNELKLLKPERTALVLAGLPTKDSSRAKLEKLRRHVTLLEDNHPGAAWARCVDAKTISATVRLQARMVGAGGLLVASFATHGVTRAGEHRLLTADASSREPHGVVLARIIDVIRAERPERLLLLVDACRREPRSGTPWPVSSLWRPHLPETFLEDVELQFPYAVLGSTGPGGFASSDAMVGNGYFTRAIVEGLQCQASTLPDGYVTLSSLEAYVSDRVRELSSDYQQTESRIGGLGRLRLVHCDAKEAGEIIAPRTGEALQPRGLVKVRIHQPELFATVLVCAAANNVCYNQNPAAAPIPTRAGETIELAVQYGTPGRFTVHAALTADPDFLRGEQEWPSVPRSREANRTVYWYGPVEITLNAPRRGGKPR